MTNLAELQARIAKATGPDHNLNLELAKWQNEVPENAFVHPQSLNGCWSVTSWANGKEWGTTEPYTSSIDAALAPVEKMLPGLYPMMVRDQRDKWRVHIDFEHVGYGPTLPLAILSALFAALVVKEKG